MTARNYLEKPVKEWIPGPHQPGIERYKVLDAGIGRTGCVTRYRPVDTGSHWWDHAYTYTDEIGARHYCTEPYWIDEKTIVLLGGLAAYGWEVTIGGFSRHGSGTLHIDMTLLRRE